MTGEGAVTMTVKPFGPNGTTVNEFDGPNSVLEWHSPQIIDFLNT